MRSEASPTGGAEGLRLRPGPGATEGAEAKRGRGCTVLSPVAQGRQFLSSARTIRAKTSSTMKIALATATCAGGQVLWWPLRQPTLAPLAPPVVLDCPTACIATSPNWDPDLGLGVPAKGRGSSCPGVRGSGSRWPTAGASECLQRSCASEGQSVPRMGRQDFDPGGPSLVLDSAITLAQGGP